MKRHLGVFLLLGAHPLGACGESSAESAPADAGVDVKVIMDAGVDGEVIVDPNCHDGAWLSALPMGSCVTGASCKVYVQYKCEPGMQYISGTQDYLCSCGNGQWDCVHTGGALALIPCDAGADAGASDAMPD